MIDSFYGCLNSIQTILHFLPLMTDVEVHNLQNVRTSMLSTVDIIACIQ